MGCDIHMVIQVKKDNTWKTISRGYDDRNYNAFAILADVRNGYGFAGTPTGSGFKPISEPRGLPDGFELNGMFGESYEFGDGEDQWMGDHSYTYVTLGELLNVKWDTVVQRYGVVAEHVYKELRAAKEKPTSWVGGCYGKDIETFSADDYDLLEFKNELPKDKKLYVNMTWDSNYKEAVGDFYDWMEELLPLAKEYNGPENIRLVFGFDS